MPTDCLPLPALATVSVPLEEVVLLWFRLLFLQFCIWSVFGILVSLMVVAVAAAEALGTVLVALVGVVLLLFQLSF